MAKFTSILCVQHLLPSVRPLLSRIRDEFDTSELIVAGKPYSTVTATLMDLDADGFARPFQNSSDIPDECFRQPSLILDEGGKLHDRFDLPLAAQVAGVEQTTSGMRNTWKYPTVLVCRSAAKLVFESQIVVRGILRKLESLHILTDRFVGVIGAGAVGSELALRLIERGHRVAVYDIVPPQGPLAEYFCPIEELLASSNLILGATGLDCLAGVFLGSLTPSVIFASCSSSNTEFASVARLLTASGPFGAATGVVGNSTVSLLNGGYPINFDREREWETLEEMSLTRQLCLHGLIQASQMVGDDAGGMMLDPRVQTRLVLDWLERVPQRETLHIPTQLDEHYFRSRSEGEIKMSSKSHYQLHSTTPAALDQMRSHVRPYDTEVAGLTIVVLPNVWSPKYDWSSAFYIENFPDVRGLSFLEIGSGTGVLSVFAGLSGAARVVASDVNPDAVENTRQNFARHGLQSAEAILSEGFDQIRGHFDVIGWNAPYHGSRPSDALERGAADEDYRGVRAFFRTVGDHLTLAGTIMFGFSESGDLPLIRNLIRDEGYRVKRELSDWRQDYNCMLLVLVREQDRSRES